MADDGAEESGRYLLEVTGRVSVEDAIAWIAEGRRLAEGVRLDLVLGELYRAQDHEFADAAVRAVVRRGAHSSVDSSVDLFGVADVTPPASYQETLNRVRALVPTGTLADLTPEIVRMAQDQNPMVMSTLGLVAGLSWRDLRDRAEVDHASVLPPSPEAEWTIDQVRGAFAAIDAIIRAERAPLLPGTAPARPVEHLLVPGEPSGWERVDALLTGGVPLGVLLAQRAVGGAWLSHRQSTTSMVTKTMVDAVCSVLAERGVEVVRIGGEDGLNKATATKLLGAPPQQVQALVVAGEHRTPRLAIAVSVARDGGTARKSGGKLRELPAQLQLPVAAVLVGPGWVDRSETVTLAQAFGGRIFTDETVDALAALAHELLR